jgi:hypothetical protein
VTMNDTIPQRPPARGPYETERQAAASVRHIYDSPPGTGAWGDGCHRLLEGACAAAGVQLGAYDHRILVWLTGWEPATCAVIAGLITRAGQTPALTDAQRATVLIALADTETYVTERAAAWCDACESAPEGACHEHVDDLDQTDRYRQLAREIGGQQ